jgi:four helix bundle protein
MEPKKRITSFRDLEVYQESYRASIEVMTKVTPKLPESERFDLKDQLSRSCKAVPRLIAEGYAKKHQKFGFQKYIDDAMAETNETIVRLEHSRDIYHVDSVLCNNLIAIYDKTARQLFRLADAWDTFKARSRHTKPTNNTGGHTSNTQP